MKTNNENIMTATEKNSGKRTYERPKLSEEELKSFAERLKNLRIKNKLSNTDMSKLLGFKTVQAYYRYEKAKSEPTSDILIKMSEALRVSCETLLDIPSKKSKMKARHRMACYYLQRSHHNYYIPGYPYRDFNDNDTIAVRINTEIHVEGDVPGVDHTAFRQDDSRPIEVLMNQHKGWVKRTVKEDKKGKKDKKTIEEVWFISDLQTLTNYAYEAKRQTDLILKAGFNALFKESFTHILYEQILANFRNDLYDKGRIIPITSKVFYENKDGIEANQAYWEKYNEEIHEYLELDRETGNAEINQNHDLLPYTLKSLREKKGLSQAEFAARLGLKPSAYNRYEAKEENAKPNIAVLRKMSKELEVSIDEILGTSEFDDLLQNETEDKIKGTIKGFCNMLAGNHGLGEGDGTEKDTGSQDSDKNPMYSFKSIPAGLIIRKKVEPVLYDPNGPEIGVNVIKKATPYEVEMSLSQDELCEIIMVSGESIKSICVEMQDIFSRTFTAIFERLLAEGKIPDTQDADYDSCFERYYCDRNNDEPYPFFDLNSFPEVTSGIHYTDYKLWGESIEEYANLE